MAYIGGGSYRPSASPVKSRPSNDLSKYQLAGGGYVNIDKAGLSNWSAIVVTVNITYGSTATAGVRVRCLYSQDGASYDSPQDADAQGNYYDPFFSAGSTVQSTIVFPILTGNLRIQIYNKDPSNAHTINNVWTTLMA